MYLAEIWRYPVKSMKGESLTTARLEMDGIAGDRLVQVRSAQGKVVTSRTRPGLLGHASTLGSDGAPRVDGRMWTSSSVALDVEGAAGAGSRLVFGDTTRRFDVLPLLVATDGAIRAFGKDGRRLRPNLVIGGAKGLEERGWEGRRLRVGTAVIEAVDLRQRCVMTTFDPDTLEQDAGVLERIRRKFGGRLGLNCRVISPGTIAVGDPVLLLDGRE